MLHTARRTLPGTPLFESWREAGVLWRAIVLRVPRIQALTLMPDHLHLLTPVPVEAALGDALRAYAQWCNHHRGRRGPVFRRRDAPTVARGRVKQRRDLRYIALNPCRARLVGDPLAWPFSTHRDAVGLAVSPARAPVADPLALHQYISADPTVRVTGTELPQPPLWRDGGPDVDTVRAAVSALTRRTLDELERRGPARSLLLRAAVHLCPAPDRSLRASLGCARSTLHDARRRGAGPDVRRVERVLGDRRFFALTDGPWRPSLR